jgi:RNA-binding, Nab2-type zinc finger
MAPCRFFAAGNCTYGTSCRNSHIFVPPDYTIRSAPETRPELSQQEVRTESSVQRKLHCWFFSQGSCRYGIACKNSHELQRPGVVLPSSAATPGISQLADEFGKIRISNGAGSSLLQSSQATGPEPCKRPGVCMFFVRGFCQNGTNCGFTHESPEIAGASTLCGNNEKEQVVCTLARASNAIY